MPAVKALLVTPSRVIAHDAPVDLNGFVSTAFVNGLLAKRGWIITADQTLSRNVMLWCVNPKLSASGEPSSSVHLTRNIRAEKAVRILTGEQIAVIGDLLIVGSIADGSRAGQASDLPAEQLREVLNL